MRTFSHRWVSQNNKSIFKQLVCSIFGFGDRATFSVTPSDRDFYLFIFFQWLQTAKVKCSNLKHQIQLIKSNAQKSLRKCKPSASPCQSSELSLSYFKKGQNNNIQYLNHVIMQDVMSDLCVGDESQHLTQTLAQYEVDLIVFIFVISRSVACGGYMYMQWLHSESFIKIRYWFMWYFYYSYRQTHASAVGDYEILTLGRTLSSQTTNLPHFTSLQQQLTCLHGALFL